MVAAPGCPSAAATGETVPVSSAGRAVLPNMSGRSHVIYVARPGLADRDVGVGLVHRDVGSIAATVSSRPAG